MKLKKLLLFAFIVYLSGPASASSFEALTGFVGAKFSYSTTLTADKPDTVAAEKSSKKPVYIPYRPVLLIIRIEDEAGATVNPANLLSVLDSGFERSYNVNRYKKNLVKVHLPNPGLYKLLINEPGFTPFESWLRIANVKTDSVIINLVKAKSMASTHQLIPATRHLSGYETKNESWLQATPTNLSLLLALILLGAGMVYLTNDVSNKLGRPHQQATEKSGLKAALFEPVNSLKAKNFSLHGEVMITAGPRKKFESGKLNDVDLGEDVCGLAMAKDAAWFWLLDGTSDQASIWSEENETEIFSSRLLAQSLAIELKEILAGQLFSPDILHKTISKIRHEWLQRIAALPAEEANRLAFVVAENTPICSSTLLIGTLNTAGLCRAYRAGDSKLLVFGAANSGTINPLKEHPGSLNDRLFFRMTYNPEAGFDIAYNKPKIEAHIFHGIDKILAYSDGVGNQLQDFLNSNQNYFSPESRKLIPYLRNMTSDDKSLCILERITEKTHLNQA